MPVDVGGVVVVPFLAADGQVSGALHVYGRRWVTLDDMVGEVELLGATMSSVLQEHGLRFELCDLASDMDAP